MADKSTPSQEEKGFFPRITQPFIVTTFLVIMVLCVILLSSPEFLFNAQENAQKLSQTQSIVTIFLFMLIFFYFFHWRILTVILTRYWKIFNITRDLTFEDKYKKHISEYDKEKIKYKRQIAYIQSWSYLLIAVALTSYTWSSA